MKTPYANTYLSLHPTTSSVLLPFTPRTTVLGLQSLDSRPKQVVGRRAPAFTIVELLIVIVVIGILATVSIIAYNGITQKAKNTAIINAASQSLKMIETYVAQSGEYPYTAPSGDSKVCVALTTGCAESSMAIGEGETFNTNMTTVGALPKTIPKLSGATRYGLMYTYNNTRMISGQSQPAALLYYIQGVGQQCGLPVVDTYQGSLQASTTGFTADSSGGFGKTACVVSISGPVHS